jgi:hypothetical protein
MIPKIIHYCWFSGDPLPPLEVKCINSWKKHCPDYEIKEWNKSNFDINYNAFTKEACEAKKYGFASDVLRYWATLEYGGFYLDADFELIKPIDEFTSHSAVMGFEFIDGIASSLMGCHAGHGFIREMLNEYDKRNLIYPDGTLNLTTSVKILTNKLLQHGLETNNELQTVADVTIYPKEYFHPRDFNTGKLRITSRTHAIHHYVGAWLNDEQKKKIEEKRIKRRKELFFRKLFGVKLGQIAFIVWRVRREEGFSGIWSRIVNRLKK